MAHYPDSTLHPFHLSFNTATSSHYPHPSPRSTIPWPTPSGTPQDSRVHITRPWAKPTPLSPEVFLPATGVDSQNYHSFLLLEPMETNPNLSSDTEPFDPSALPSTLANSMLAVDTRSTDHPQEPVVYFSGSESDSGHELDDDHNTTRDASKDQPTSIPAVSPQGKSLDVVLSRRSASFLAIEVPTLHPLLIPPRLIISL